MSKNLTRKGLAFGAILALGSSLFAGTAAHAADELTLAPKLGTAYKTIEGEAFTLLAGLAPSTNASNTVQLKYQVVTTATLGTVAVDNTSGADTTTGVTAGQPTNTTVYKTNNTPTVGYAQTIALTSSASVVSGTPETATVTAFFDADNDDLLDAGEYTSAARTVTWVDFADVTGSVSVTTPAQGDTTIKATASLADINQEMMAATTVGFYFTNAAGTAFSSPATATNTTAAASTEDIKVSAAVASGVFSATSNPVAGAGGLGSTGGVKVTAYYKPAATAAANFVSNASGATVIHTGALLIGSATSAITVRTVATVTLDAPATANNQVIGGTVANVTTTAGAATLTARKNSEVTVTATLADGSTPAVALANIPVTVTATATSFVSADAKSVSLNGTSYATSALLAAASATLTSDSKGVVTVKLNTTGFVDGNQVVITFKAQGYQSAVTVTARDITLSLVEDGAVSASAYRSVVKGSAVTMGYTLVDQFKQVPSTGSYRLVATAGSVTTSGVTAGATYVNFTAGKASVSYTPSGAGTFTVTSSVELQNTSTLNWGNPAQGALALSAVTVNSIAAQTDEVTATSSSSTTAAAVASADEKAIDTRVAIGAVATYVTGEATTVSGTVSQAVTGITRSGAAVTVSGAGLLFSTAYNGTVFSADKITVYADNSGAYSVAALSNVAGTFTITVTSGSATKTATAKFASSLAPAKVAVKVADGAAQFQSGRALDVTFSVTDKHGNAVATPASGSDVGVLTIGQTGAGYLTNTGVVTATTSGYTTKLITNAGDLGTSTITATLDLATDVVATATSEFGITDVTDISSAGKAIYVNTEFAKGKVVTVYIDGKRMPVKAAEATDNAVERKYTQKTAGKHTVTVRVSGGVVASETVVTTK
jgi:hypothetical protein